MKRQFVAIILFSVSISYAHAASDVYLCVDEHGERRYRNSGAAKGCKKVDLPGITTEPKARKKPPIAIGMTKDQVTKKWGKPSMIRRTQTRNSITETWSYSGGKVLTFANGSLEIIQE
jgi:hypothetical protein